MLRWVLFEFIFVSTCGYAIWRGGTPERFASLTFVGAATLTLFMRRFTETPLHLPIASFQHIEASVMLVDLAVFCVMLWLAFSSERFWPIWMAAMAGIIVFTHTSMLLKLDILPWAYWRSQALWSYPMQLLLAVATWRHQARLKRLGADPSWRRSFSR